MGPLAGAAVGGFAGFLIESLTRGEYFKSPAWRGAPIPFVPTYAAGGAIHTLISPSISSAPWYVRGAVYSAAFTTLEYVACHVDRDLGRQTWAYGPTNACIDLEHSLAWGVLGLCAEPILR